jgi:DNA mismatch endonuclease (patch repair protein)
MADVFSKEERSSIMSRVRSRGNQRTEMALVAYFRAHSITGWRRHQKLFGNPDIVFPRDRIALFIDGCFWHNCPIHGTAPASNKAFWKRKLERNKSRDRLVNRTLRKRGWKVVRIWQHELSHAKQRYLAKRLKRSIPSYDSKV